MLRVAAANFRVVADRVNNLDRAAALGARAAEKGAGLFVSIPYPASKRRCSRYGVERHVCRALALAADRLPGVARAVPGAAGGVHRNVRRRALCPELGDPRVRREW